jgi:Tol biopolymer transport system component
VLRSLPFGGWQLIELPPDLPSRRALEWFRRRPEVVAAEPNQRYRAHRVANDPERSRLYGLERIAAPAAWDISSGDAGVVVAVFDTGMNLTHPDLAPNLWKNPAEVPGNRIDDDANGWADDVHGIDVVDGDGDPSDDAGHGTHVAGTIGAVGDNGVGVVGVAWRVQLMPVRVLSVDGSGTTVELASAFDYVVRLKRRGVNVRVINCSWGGGFPSLALREAMQAAAAEGILMVCSAGNDHADLDARPTFPAVYDLPEIVSVGASTTCDEPSSFSNQGRVTVDLAAPGSGILSTFRGGERYAVLSGTSMAAPHVSGAAALLFGMRPEARPAEIRSLLLGTTDAVPSWQGLSRTGGRLHVGRAMEAARANQIPSELAEVARPGARMTGVSRSVNGRWGSGRSFQPSISADGRWVAFVSAATNLVAGDTEGYLDVFLVDRVGRTVERVSQTRSGAGGLGDSEGPSVSADGRFVAFVSSAANLVPGDGNEVRDVFLWDRSSRQVELVSVRADGRSSGNGVSEVPMINRDGTLVVFASDATDLVSGDRNQVRDVFVRDRSRRSTERVSVASDGAEAFDWSDAPTISADGSTVAFHSAAPNLVSGDVNLKWDVFVRDRSRGRTEALVRDVVGDDDSLYPLVSETGRWVAFSSAATNYAGGPTGGKLVLLLADRQGNRIVRAGGLAPGVLPQSDALAFGISADGRFVSVTTDEPGLAPGGELGFYRTFLFDRLRGIHEWVALSDAGLVAEDSSFYGPVSADGRYLAFVSNASGLVPGDGNAVGDVFVRDRGDAIADLSVRVAGTNRWSGDGILNPLRPQRVGRVVEIGGTAEYEVVLANAGEARPFVMKVSAVSAGWTLQVRAAPQGNGQGPDITAALLGNGWTSPSLAAGEQQVIRVRVTQGGAVGESQGTARFEVRSASEESALDAVNLVTTTVLPPPGWTLVSRGADGALAERSAEAASLSRDARRVVFSSDSDQLDARSDLNFQSDVFLVDRAAGTVSRLSDASPSAQGNGDSRYPSLSADGTRVVFQSKADNLVASDSNEVEDIFLKDLASGALSRVSVSAAGGQANRGSEGAFLSGGGRHVVFTSFASNLVEGDTNRCQDVFLRDLETGTTECVSRAASGALGDADSEGGVVSADGRFVVFTSLARGLSPQDRNVYADVYLWDRTTRTMELVSANTNGVAANGSSGGGSISDDGRWLTFHSYASDLVPGVSGNERHSYLLDRTTGRRQRVADRIGVMPEGYEVRSAVVSPDGRWLGLTGAPGCGLGRSLAQVFVYDLVGARLDRVSVLRGGDFGDGHSVPLRFSADGRYLAFESWADNLRSEPGPAAGQVYVADLARARLDALVKAVGDWRGEGAGTVETRPATVVLIRSATGGEASAFTLRVRNDGNTRDRFRIRAEPPTGVNLRVQGDEVSTTELGGPGGRQAWRTGWVPPGLTVDVRISLTTAPDSRGDWNLSILVESEADSSRSDWVRVTAAVDDDADGMPDSWETRFFGGTTLAGLGTDGDGDGASDLIEWVAGTDPTRPGDALKLGIEAVSDGGMVRLTWRSRAGFRYRVERSLGLGAGFVDVGAGPVEGTGEDLAWQDSEPPTGEARFYRLKAETP